MAISSDNISRYPAVLVLLILCFCPGLSAQDVSVENPAQEVLVGPAGVAYAVVPRFPDVRLNGADRGRVLVLQGEGKNFWLPRDLALRWRLRGGGDYRFRQRSFIALHELAGFEAELNSDASELQLTLAAEAFKAGHINLAGNIAASAPTRSDVGGFFNYDLAVQHGEGLSEQRTTLGGLVELGAFYPGGVVLHRSLTPQWQRSDGGRMQRGAIRLDSRWVMDEPQSMRRLEIGDAVSRSGLGGRPLRFGGVSWGREFTTQPGFVTLPQPSLSGSSALPSVLEVYVNGQRRHREEVEAGPFVVTDIPMLTGDGQVELLVRDMLGREQLVSASYFTGSRQLRTGLTDYHLAAGWLRENYGLRSNDYAEAFGSGLYRYGVSDYLTLEGRATVADNNHSVGAVALTAGVPRLGNVDLALAHSRVKSEEGHSVLVSYQRSSRGRISVGLRGQYFSQSFREVGDGELGRDTEMLLGANAALHWQALGTLGVSRVEQHYYDRRVVINALTLTRRIQHASLQVRVSDSGGNGQRYYSLNLSLPLGREQHVSAGLRQRRDAALSSNQHYLRVQKNVPRRLGYGYSASLYRDEIEGRAGLTSQLSGELHSDHAEWRARFDESEYSRYGEISVAGGVAMAAGHLAATRPIDESFALVSTDRPGVALRVNGQAIAKTDSRGIAVLPDLQAYRRNNIALDPAHLPIDIDASARQISLAPHYRSGNLLEFSVARRRGVRVELRDADGRSLPTGARAHLVGGDDTFPIGHGGRTYLPNVLPGKHSLEVSWGQRRCVAALMVPDDAAFDQLIAAGPCERLNTPQSGPEKR